MNRLILAAGLAIVAASATAGKRLADVKSIHLDLSLPDNIAGCRGDFERAAAHEHIVLLKREQADAVLKVDIKYRLKAPRHYLDWTMSFTLGSGQQALAESGEESGWSALGACSDLAEDIMEDLRDELSRARLDQFR